jgi:bifunctional UDP-N-acetylglucosamine pyrophosphorylase/glucosamine-1-phosphate N-acetyltransferase
MPRGPKKTTLPAAGKLEGFAIAILAAGKGTRLKSKHPKVLHAVAGKPLLLHVIEAARQVVPAERIFAIIGHEAERVRQTVAHSGVRFVTQAEQRGTGHALTCAASALASFANVLVLSGDVPLIRPQAIRRLADFHLQHRAAMTVLTARPPDATGYGRILRRRGAEIGAIVEQKALRGKQQKISEINSGIYSFRVKDLLTHLNSLTTDNFHGEYYLTDVAALLVRARQKVLALEGEDPQEVLGVNTRAELAHLDMLLRKQKAEELMAAGVTLLRPETCLIDGQVEVAADTIIEPFVHLSGKTIIGGDCCIGSFSVIRDSEIADGVEIRPGCVITESRVHKSAILGPYSHLRPGSEIGEGAHVGNFVETKKTRLGKGAKANHLTYLGDSEIGANVNVGAGTITCNYDGISKHPTIIEEGAFIGSDATLVAPVRIGAGAYIAAGSCITQDVPPDALALGRAYQTVKEGWAKKRREARAAKKS